MSIETVSSVMYQGLLMMSRLVRSQIFWGYIGRRWTKGVQTDMLRVHVETGDGGSTNLKYSRPIIPYAGLPVTPHGSKGITDCRVNYRTSPCFFGGLK